MDKKTKQKKQNYIAKTPVQTKKIGELLAMEILKSGLSKTARVLTLAGDLGAGKTNFIQGFAQGLGIKETVNSPTFVIFRVYALRSGFGFDKFYHFDCYRLGSADDLAGLGAEKIFANPRNIVALEWPEIIRSVLPKKILTVHLDTVDPETRRVSLGWPAD